MSYRIINLVTHMEAGGAQGAAIRMSASMRDRGIISETWFIYKKSDTYINEPFVRVIYHSPPNNIVDAFKIVRLLIKAFKEFRPNSVISYTHYASTLGHIASYVCKVPNRVATMRNPAWSYPKLARLLNIFMGRFGFYTKIITVSQSVKDSCQNYSQQYNDLIEVVYNGVPARISQLNQSDARKKFHFNLVDGERLLVTVGRLHPQKNQKLIIEMMKGLPNYHLAIAGKGELESEFISLIEKLDISRRVLLMGEISPNEIPDFLKCGDIFLFPSNFEAFGFAIFEAAHNGLPIIASNIPSNNEVLKLSDGNMAGIIVSDMSISNWVSAVTKMENPTLLNKYREAIALKSKSFGFNIMVDKYIELASLYEKGS